MHKFRQDSQSWPSQATCPQCLGFLSTLLCATTPFPGFYQNHHHHRRRHRRCFQGVRGQNIWVGNQKAISLFNTCNEILQPCDPREDKIEDPGNPGSRLCGDRSFLLARLTHRHLCLRQGARPLHSGVPTSPRYQSAIKADKSENYSSLSPGRIMRSSETNTNFVTNLDTGQSNLVAIVSFWFSEYFHSICLLGFHPQGQSPALGSSWWTTSSTSSPSSPSPPTSPSLPSP